jgi:thioredoxin reductase (NADPH)
VVLAVGLGNGRLGLANEDGFEGRGLSHCAACDGPLYVGQRVVVAGHDRWAVQEALDLAALAEQVTLVTQGGEPDERAAALGTLPNAAIWPGRITALTGEAGLESVTVAQEGQSTVLPAHAIFVQSGRRAPLDFAGDLAAPGLFLAGDCRPGAEETVAAAEADGARAGAAAAAFARG